MARITIEDALQRIPNRFELTLAATKKTIFNGLLAGLMIFKAAMARI